jgi:hypothetical protein
VPLGSLLLSLLVRRRLNPGEAVVARILKRYCVAVANDVIFPDGRGGLTQIDHLALTSRGILVVETKHFAGLIFGRERDATWTQCVASGRIRFYNPLRQNYGHVKAVQYFVTHRPVTGLVVFTGSSEFPKGLPKGVCTLSELPTILFRLGSEPIDPTLKAAWDDLLTHQFTNKEARYAHLRLVRQKRKW